MLPFFVILKLIATKISIKNFRVNNKEIDCIEIVYLSIQYFIPLEYYPTPVEFKPNIFKAIFNIAQPSSIINLHWFIGLLQNNVNMSRLLKSIVLAVFIRHYNTIILYATYIIKGEYIHLSMKNELTIIAFKNTEITFYTHITIDTI